MQALAIDPDLAFYNQIANHIGQQSLTSKQAERAYIIRSRAVKRYEGIGVLEPPPGIYQLSLLDTVTWFIAQSDVYKGELG